LYPQTNPQFFKIGDHYNGIIGMKKGLIIIITSAALFISFDADAQEINEKGKNPAETWHSLFQTISPTKTYSP
jgi:hypothetical protein